MIVGASMKLAAQRANILATIHLFRGLSSVVTERLIAASVRKSYRKGERIFFQGDDGDFLYGVVSGLVRIDAIGISGRDMFLNQMRPGDCFGEISIIDGLPRTAGATAVSGAALCAIPGSVLLKSMSEEPRLAMRLLLLICKRLRWTTDLCEDSTLLSSRARLAKRILKLTQLQGAQLDGDVELRISQTDLARFVGVSRKSVNQYLQSWKERGWVKVAHARLLVRNPDALGRLASGVDEERTIG